MSKTSTELVRHGLNGPTMGTRWSALFFAAPWFDPAPLNAALQAAVDEVDAQMSTWKPGSDLMRLNAAPAGEWVPVPARLMEVLRLGLEIGRASGGAFEIGLGDAVRAWGFGPEAAMPDRIRAAMNAPRLAAAEALELDAAARRVRKRAPIALDLNGIAKGYGVDRLAETLMDFGIPSGLVGIDGEMRALGLRADGDAWTVAVERPDSGRRAPPFDPRTGGRGGRDLGRVPSLGRGARAPAVAYHGPARGAPLLASPASVTVVARSCVEADAWATALMVLGPGKGARLARRLGLDALFLLRDGDREIRSAGVGPLFSKEPTAFAPAGER